MQRTPRPLRVILSLMFIVSAGCDAGNGGDAAPIGAAQVDAAEFAPVNRSDITGTVQLEEEDDQATITVALVGLEAGVEYPVHVHTGRCAAGGAVAVPLGQVTGEEDGRGQLTTRVALTALQGDQHVFVQAHGPSGGAVACADLGGGDGGAALTERLHPDSTPVPAAIDTGAGA